MSYIFSNIFSRSPQIGKTIVNILYVVILAFAPFTNGDKISIISSLEEVFLCLQ
jgi:hypothetical protein